MEKEKPFSTTMNRTHGHPARSLVTVLTTLTQLHNDNIVKLERAIDNLTVTISGYSYHR